MPVAVMDCNSSVEGASEGAFVGMTVKAGVEDGSGVGVTAIGVCVGVAPVTAAEVGETVGVGVIVGTGVGVCVEVGARNGLGLTALDRVGAGAGVKVGVEEGVDERSGTPSGVGDVGCSGAVVPVLSGAGGTVGVGPPHPIRMATSTRTPRFTACLTCTPGPFPIGWRELNEVP